MNGPQAQVQADDLAIFHEVSQALLMQLDEEIILGLLCQLTVTHFDLRLAWYAHVQPDDPYLVPEYAFGDALDYLNNLLVTHDDSQSGRSPSGQAARTGKPVAQNHLLESAAHVSGHDRAIAHGITSSAAFPLVFDHTPLGVLSLYAGEAGFFTSERMQLFQSLANMAAIALHNSSLFLQTNHRMAEVSTIYQTSQRLQVIQPLSELAAQVLTLLRRNLDFEFVSVRLLDPATRTLRLFAATRGGNRPSPALPPAIPDQIPLGVGIPGLVAQRGRTVRLGDVRGDPWYVEHRPATRSVLCVPMKVQGALIGVITMESTLLNAYAHEDQQVLETIATQIAVAVHNARLVDQLRASEARVRKLMREQMTLQEQERRRISRELHDETGQDLAALKINLSFLKSELGPEQSEARGLLEQGLQLADQIIKHHRRIAHDLRPAALDTSTIEEVLAAYCANVQADFGLPIHFEATGALRLPDDVATALYRALQNALSTILDHEATARVQVRLCDEGQAALLHVREEGAAFAGLDDSQEWNVIRNLQERIEQMGGQMDLSVSDGQGADLRVRIPLEKTP